MTITPTPHWCAIASLGVRCVNEVNGNDVVGGQAVAAFLGKLAFCEQNDYLALRKCARKVINKRGTWRSPRQLLIELVVLVINFCHCCEAEIVSFAE